MSRQETTPYTLGEIEQGTPCCVPKALLRVRDLAVSYGEITVLSQVSLDIYKGCITALIGPSGCGKTSFLSTLNRLTDHHERARVNGRILFDGQDLLCDPVDTLRLRRRIGMIFQRPNPFPLSIWRNLELPLKEHGVRDRQTRYRKIEQALKDVGLWDEVSDRLGISALVLSGGQQQRLCIARALVLEPEILLMDEPCSALDPISSGVVEELILRLRGRYTVVIVTHNLAQARRVANYAGFFWMTERVGKLIEFGQCQHLFETPSHELTAAYISGARG
ncbi:phosphate ABC transporter ATP-binding protein, PhoT family [Nitrosococcus oceani ATCC 19707]|uniref:Phosphate import ATP-binding protein PstB 1 n=1 Tax=Nitrosococcus oceani (strain ATCC 19707 / BCRC 17464 / JCM 30415 / NCIMB 11848 / C-107) TaxID=323261 RepID=PSTB1_NITOC|nr:phosphate ABC transporter ATP-binding protein [Nitrosococcus oceani]Q3JDJ6.1 RecName: Full=Phosphate import ATP-binding protein PstB 1; AltName: Full=ABC phosphate transporter 1; AltName: Full=Phosphate-transporting ATPase 1 [Nitrosococcus oceani ATCC 19707]ABA57100.1 phosphate ABC transporter ATP-binding protein, PhoT family [Nitrosococcus oceani ATCC 19707]GEM19880.1 phosphate ABC transporter ATP-binding protein [Nitrosococcus oceani]